MAFEAIKKNPKSFKVAPNLADYARTCAVFSWETTERELTKLPDGRGLNIAYECVDRHAQGARRDRTHAEDAMTQTGDSVKERVKTEKKEPELYKVILLNDDYTTMEFVVSVLESVFQKSPAEAYRSLEHLNNKYALDGRDPNSYSGILWCFGLFDRPWGPERPVFGSVRYMSSENTARKFKLGGYFAYVDRLSTADPRQTG